MSIGLVFSEILYMTFILVVIVILYFIIKDINEFNIYTKEIQVEVDPEKVMEVLYESLKQRGYAAARIDKGIMVSFAGVKYELRHVTLPNPSIIVKINVFKISILIGVILFLIYVFGWLLLVIWGLLVYDRYNKILYLIYTSKESIKA
ncbi:MAG: hypothetical protein GSR85_10195 [Desulfurococcales archaeon]|nr:hypothetical protein [Desulfurococcales archaeon]